MGCSHCSIVRGGYRVHLKGKLAHIFMISYLVLISCLSDMVTIFVIDRNTKIDFILQGKENQMSDPLYFGFPNQSLSYVI